MQQGQVKVLELQVVGDVVNVVDVVVIVVVIRLVIRGVIRAVIRLVMISSTRKVKLLESTKKVPCLPSHPDVEVYAPICQFFTYKRYKRCGSMISTPRLL